MVFLCAKIEKSKPKMNKFGHVHIWPFCPPPPKNFFLFLYFFSKLVSKLLVIFVRSCPNWNGRNSSVSPVEKRRALGFYRNNNSGYNRCELLTLEIYFLESVWSSIGNETWARSGIAIVVPMKISEGARSFSKQHKTSNLFLPFQPKAHQFFTQKISPKYYRNRFYVTK